MLRKLFHSFVFAARGLGFTISTQRNFRIHLFALCSVVIAGFIFRLNIFEWLFVLGSSCLVIMAELFNTAIEALCNKVHPEKDRQIGKVKDISAAAVLVAAIFAFVTGLLIFGNKIIAQY